MFTHEKKTSMSTPTNAHREKKNLKFQSKLEIKISVEKFKIYILMNESFKAFIVVVG